MLKRFLFLLALLTGSTAMAADVTEYLPENHHYDESVVKPEDILGFGLGERHIRHDQLLRYFEMLTEHSERAVMTEIGMTN